MAFFLIIGKPIRYPFNKSWHWIPKQRFKTEKFVRYEWLWFNFGLDDIGI